MSTYDFSTVYNLCNLIKEQLTELLRQTLTREGGVVVVVAVVVAAVAAAAVVVVVVV